MITDDPLKIQRPPPSSCGFCHRLPCCSHRVTVVSLFDLHLLPFFCLFPGPVLFLSLHYPSENTASLFSRSPAAVLHLSPNLPLTHRGLTDLGISTPQQLFPNTATGASV